MSKEKLCAYKWLIRDNDPRLSAEESSPSRRSLDILKEIDSLRCRSLGTHAFYDERNRIRLEELQLEMLSSLGKFFPVQGEERTYVCNSRWGALAALYIMSQRINGGGSVLLFRGQGDFRWDLTPSIDRISNPKERLLQDSKTDDFVRKISSKRSDLGLTTARSLGLSIAQHFGFKTSLMDWTYDPAIALWFATYRRHLSKESTTNGWPCVWMLPINHIVEDGLDIVLPEPSIRRIYDQRGVMLDCSRSKNLWQQHAFKVIFDDEGKLTPRFNPFWQGITKRIYRPTEWVSAIAERVDECSSVTAKLPRPNESIWIQRAYEVLNSLCLVCDAEGKSVQVERSIIQCLAEQNEHIVLKLAERLEGLGATRNSPERQIAKLIRECF